MMALKHLLERPRSLWLRVPLWIVAAWILLLLGRFMIDLVWPYRPKPVAEVAFLDHAETERIGPVRVTAAALSPAESALARCGCGSPSGSWRPGSCCCSGDS